MCGRYVVRFSKTAFEETFNVQPPLFDVTSYNLAPMQQGAMIWAPEGEREVAQARWSLLPRWVKDPLDFKASMFNARAESLLEKASFKRPLQRQRCLVPASGFYEWKKVGGSKQPYYIHARDESPLAFAGLWEHWAKAGREVLSFTIITTTPNGLMSSLHDRMPVILERDAFSDWLDPEIDGAQLLHLLRPLEDGKLEAHPVDRRVGKVSENDSGLIEPLADEGEET